MARLMQCKPNTHQNPTVIASVLEKILICVQKSLHSKPVCNQQTNYLNKSHPEKTTGVIKNKNILFFLISCFLSLQILVAEIHTTKLQP
jgi:hypothetical protein